MAEFKLGRIKFVWKGPWNASTAYYKDDVVIAGGISYNCITAHTSVSTFAGDASNWQQMSGGVNYITGSFTGPNTSYNVGDLLTVNGNVYYCTVSHASASTWVADIANWTLYSPGLKSRGAWVSNTQYYINDLVTFGADVYICVLANSDSSFNPSKFTLFVQGLQFEDAWNSAMGYQIGDVTTYGGYAYVAKTINSNSVPTINTADWGILTTGYSNAGTWNSATPYKIGSVVQFGGWSYVANQDSTNQQPYIGSSGVNLSYWSLLVKGFNNRGNYADSFATTTASASGGTATIGFATQSAAPFQIGNNIVVSGVTPTQFNGVFVVTACTTSSVSFSLAGIYGPQTIAGNVYGIYYPGDVVVSAGSTYVASAVTSRTLPPGSNWSLLSQSGLSVSLTTSGDIPYNSSGSVTALHMNAGTQAGGQVVDGYVLKALTQSGDGSLQPRWGELGFVTNVYYVAPSGTDATGYGRTLDKPFASIKYACANVTGPAVINVKAGTYAEQLPITVRANITVRGDSLRTVIVTPKAGISDDAVTPNNRSRMFMMADGAIVTDLTCQGLTGQLTASPYIVGDTTNVTGILRNTAGTWPSATASGAYFSLDPASTITSKSPYVINVTVFGTNAVAVYANGADQASGNKSFLISNFSSIIDNGIGVWARNQARVEEISSHTYYAYIGYCAETGAMIRSQLGSTTYGTFGAVASDLDPTDTGTSGTVSQISATVGNTLTIQGLSKVPRPGNVIVITGYSTQLVIASIVSYVAGTAVVVTQNSFSGVLVNAPVVVYQKFSNIRLTAHDFCAVGTGSVSATGYPNVNYYNVNPAFQSVSQNSGVVYYAAMDQDGNFNQNGLITTNVSTGVATITGLNTASFTPGREPATPTAGMMAVSNGTTWNPAGDGLQHLLVYLNGAWQKIA